MELSRSYNVTNNLGITKGEREWYLNYDNDFDTLITTDTGLFKSVDRTVFGQIANGDRIVIFRNGKKTGKCATILSGSSGKCICFTYPEEQEVFVLPQGNNRLGTLDITEAFDDYRGFVDKICIVPLATTTVNTQIDYEIDGNAIGNITIPAGTSAGSLLVFDVGPHYISEEIKAHRNAETLDRSECVLFAVCKRNQKSDGVITLGVNEKAAYVETRNIGAFANVFRFGTFVRVKGFAVVPIEQNLLAVNFKVRSVLGVDITGDVMSLPNASPVGVPVYGCMLNYITKSVDFRVSAGVLSATKARVYVIYETLSNRVRYSYIISNANAVTRFVCNDVFDANIEKVILDARTVADMNKGNFSITLAQGAGDIVQNVDCYRTQATPAVLANTNLTPGTTIGATNVATGGNTNPVTVSLELFLE